MGTNITDAALRVLEIYRRWIGSPQYIELLRIADDIRRERGAAWLGQVHCELAMERLAGESEHARV